MVCIGRSCRKRAADDLLQRQLPSGASALAAGKLHEPIMLAVLHARKQHLDTLLGSLHVVLREDGLEWVKVQSQSPDFLDIASS